MLNVETFQLRPIRDQKIGKDRSAYQYTHATLLPSFMYVDAGKGGGISNFHCCAEGVTGLLYTDTLPITAMSAVGHWTLNAIIPPVIRPWPIRSGRGALRQSRDVSSQRRRSRKPGVDCSIR